MKLFIHIISFLIIVTTAYSQIDTNWRWATTVPFTYGVHFPTLMQMDSGGNFYIGGDFFVDDTANIKSGNEKQKKFFLLKSNPEGKVLWVKTLGSDYDDNLNSLAVDKEGNSYICGRFRDSLDFGNGVTHVPNRVADGFLAKYDTDGNLLWVNIITNGKTGLSPAEDVTQVHLDNEGNVLIGGIGVDTMSFGNNVVVYPRFTILPNKIYGFFAKFSSSGQALWAGNSIAIPRYMGIDKSNNIYAAGQFKNSLMFDNGDSLASRGDDDIWIAKYSSSGENLWLRSAGSKMYELMNAFAVDSVGNVYISGRARDTMYFNQRDEPNVMSTANTYLAQYTPDGKASWVKGLSSYYNTKLSSVTIKLNQNVVVTGDFVETVTFEDSITLSNVGNNEIILLEYTSAGKLVTWARAGDSNSATPQTVAIQDNSIYICGFYGDTTGFGNIIIGNPKNTSLYPEYNIFIAEYRDRFHDSTQTGGKIDSSGLALQVYPNPAQGKASISFSTTENSQMRLLITDVLGRRTLLKEELISSGAQTIEINTDQFAIGTYVLTLEAQGQIISMKIVIL